MAIATDSRSKWQYCGSLAVDARIATTKYERPTTSNQSTKSAHGGLDPGSVEVRKRER